VDAFVANVKELERTFSTVPEEVSVVSTAAEYRAARQKGRHAAFLGVQGGNAFDEDLSVLERLPPGRILRVTLVHLSNSGVGSTSSPFGSLRPNGLERDGLELVRVLDERRVFVDLAHASPLAFWDAVEAHDRSRPLLVSHTGVSGVHRHWRNLDDAQIRAVADTGGVVGILYHAPFLGDRPWSGRVDSVARHLEHVRKVGGDDAPALGSDWDGAIITPRDMPTCLELPRLVEALLRRGYPEQALVKLLGSNFLRSLSELRGG
jgi:membrane dipeptidase